MKLNLADRVHAVIFAYETGLVRREKRHPERGYANGTLVARTKCACLPVHEGPVMTIYQHIRHPRIAARRADRPVKVADFLPRGTAINRFNTKVALIITSVVGSMWCAYAFALFDLISLPAAIRGGASEIVSWVAQTFLQLVLLSVIMVGQNVQAAAADKRAEATFHDASATLHEVAHVQGHPAPECS